MSPLAFQHVYKPGLSPDSGTLILLHGTGGDENDLISLGSDLLPEAGILSPRGQVSENGALRSKRYRFNASRAYAVGLSNGANAASGLLLLNPDLLAGGVLFRPMFVVEVSPRPKLAGKAILINAGATDPLLPPGDTERLRAQFSRAGAKVTVHVHEAGHHLVSSDITQSRAWLRSRKSP